MQVGDIITLDYDEKYLLLSKITSNKKVYFLAIGVTKDEKDIDMDDITYFEEIIENNELFIKEVYNEELLEALSDASILKSMRDTKNIKRIINNYYETKKS